MREAPTYPIATLHDMARIPVEALPRFLAELPAILGEVRHVQSVQDTFNAQFEGVMKFNIEDAGKPEWIDDDLGVATITVSLPDGDRLRVGRPLTPTSAPSA